MYVRCAAGWKWDWSGNGVALGGAGRRFGWHGCISRTNTQFAQYVVHRLIARRVPRKAQFIGS